MLCRYWVWLYVKCVQIINKVPGVFAEELDLDWVCYSTNEALPAALMGSLMCCFPRACASLSLTEQTLSTDISLGWKFDLTLWLCSDSCHTCDVPGQKWPDSKQLLINLSLCYSITKYWIHSFCQLVFFHLGLVLCFYLHLINRKPHLSESKNLFFEWKKAFFMNNFHNMR